MSEMETREASVEVVNRAGMHARPAAELVKLAGTFQSEIHVEKDGLQVNGKSIMGVLMLAAEQGSILRFTASGTDSGEALEALTALVRRGFEEE
jgi:phosphocarrier protein